LKLTVVPSIHVSSFQPWRRKGSKQGVFHFPIKCENLLMNTRSFGLNQQSVRSDLRADNVMETSKPFGLNQQSVRSDMRADNVVETSKPEAREGKNALSETWKEETEKSDEEKKQKVTKC
jgi:hypothetical protein